MSTLISASETTVPATTTTVEIDEVKEIAMSSGLDDPTTLELPAGNPGELRTWFEGDGRLLVELTTVTGRLVAAGASTCPQVADDLDSLGSPEYLASLADLTPDAVVREVMSGLQRAIAGVLSTCVDDAADSDATVELAWQWLLADRVLREAGVTP